ncbi:MULTISPECIES: nickel pincer cofactor biosynthesis protein LarC [Protofrankia]|uniref:nickel pincer cofactor biosynthesis protein LarC n=1 Tax=Protofrankia TaxID=2994361 RepID=UPI00069C75F5|nr:MULTISPECIES: nickel pincer cofactor biosynthesis protein LarC [Protofrankia]ONH34112.1 TIGR00299 family protein [Protofrankia sp. BMG5.30]
MTDARPPSAHPRSAQPAGPDPAAGQVRLGWLDLSSGASGDMLLGALIGALAGMGRPTGVIGEAVDALGLPVRLDVSSTSRAGLAATRVHVITDSDIAETGGGDGTIAAAPVAGPGTHKDHHGHRHHHGPGGDGRPGGQGDGQPRRTWPDVRRLLTRAPLADTVREHALATFAALAEAEAAVHGIPADEVHFHEVGALDALADVVGACAGIAALGLDQLVVSAVALGGGSARTEHGVLPIPGPAVLELLRAAGLPGHGGPVDVELCTPTGAALVAAHADASGPLPPMRVCAIGVGAGRRDIPGRPNIVRLVVGCAPRPGPLISVPATGGRASLPHAPLARAPRLPHASQAPDSFAPDVAVDAPVPDAATLEAPGAGVPGAVDELLIETNVDDLDPRAWPEIMAALLAAGARDVWLTPILMKKGRPAHTLSVLVRAPHADAVRRLVFLHTPTLGLRETTVRKRALDRAFRTVDVGGETIAVKIGMLAGGRAVTAQPEWDDVRRAAIRLGQPTRRVLAAAAAAALNTDGAPLPTAGRDGGSGTDLRDDTATTDNAHTASNVHIMSNTNRTGKTGMADDAGTGDDSTQTGMPS